MLSTLAVSLVASLALPQDATRPDPRDVFDELWRVYDRTYPMLEVEDLRWDALRELYRPRLTAESSDEELFGVLSEMLHHLDDNHVLLQAPAGHPDENLVTGDNSVWDGERLVNVANDGYSTELIDEAYVLGTLTSRMMGSVRFGRLAENVGYLQLSAFDDGAQTGAAMDEALADADDFDALVIDLRGNGGGGDEAVRQILGRLTDRERLFGFRRSRRPKGPNAFSEPIPMRIAPIGDAPFTRPVFVLTTRHSTSAADVFAMAATTLPNVVLIGESTSGSFSAILGLRLANGWLYSVPYELVTDHRGRSWEGIGIQPDLYAVNTAADVANGRDRVIELAVALAEQELEPGYDDPATRSAPPSLARELARWLDENDDPYMAVANVRRSRGDGYLASEELWSLAGERLAAGKRDQVLAILELLFVDLDGEWMFANPGRDWGKLLGANDEEITARIFAAARELDPDFPVGGRLRARALEAGR